MCFKRQLRRRKKKEGEGRVGERGRAGALLDVLWKEILKVDILDLFCCVCAQKLPVELVRRFREIEPSACLLFGLENVIQFGKYLIRFAQRYCTS